MGRSGLCGRRRRCCQEHTKRSLLARRAIRPILRARCASTARAAARAAAAGGRARRSCRRSRRPPWRVRKLQRALALPLTLHSRRSAAARSRAGASRASRAFCSAVAVAPLTSCLSPNLETPSSIQSSVAPLWPGGMTFDTAPGRPPRCPAAPVPQPWAVRPRRPCPPVPHRLNLPSVNGAAPPRCSTHC